MQRLCTYTGIFCQHGKILLENSWPESHTPSFPAWIGLTLEHSWTKGHSNRIKVSLQWDFNKWIKLYWTLEFQGVFKIELFKNLKHNLLMLFWTTKIGQTLKKVHLINFGMLWGIIVILGTKGSIMGKHWFSVHFSLLGPTDPPQN